MVDPVRIGRPGLEAMAIWCRSGESTLSFMVDEQIMDRGWTARGDFSKKFSFQRHFTLGGQPRHFTRAKVICT